MFSRIAFIASLAFCLNAAAQQQPVTKVGVINIQEALVGTRDGKKATEELDQKFLPEQKEFDARQNEVIQLQDQLSKGSALFSEEKRNELARDIDEKKKRLERDMQDAEDDLKAEQQKLLQSMAARMTAVISQYAKDNGFLLVIDVGNQNTPVLFAAAGVDITQDVIALYDKGPAH
jgi:Skp family chaperone for outer membrane proteins